MYVQGSHLFGVAKQLRIAFSKFFSDVVCSFAVRFFFVLLAAAELVFLLTSKCNSNYKWKFNSEVLSLFCFECYCVFVTKEIHLSAMSR